MKTDALGGREAITLCSTLIIINAFHPVTALVQSAAGSAAWMSQLIAMAVGVAYALIITAVCAGLRKRRENNIQDSLPGRVGSALMCVLALKYAAEMARYMLNALTVNLLPATPMYFKVLLVVLICLPAVMRGINPIARVSRLTMGVMLLGIALLVLSVIKYASFSNLTPLLGYGAGGIMTGAAAASFAFFPLCFIGCMEDKLEGSVKRITVTAAVIGGAGVLLLTVLNTLAFPFNMHINTEMPLQSLIYELDFTVSIGRIQAVYLSLYVLTVLSGISASIALSSRLFSQAFNVQNKKWLAPGFAVILFVLCILPLDAMPQAVASLIGPSIYHALWPVIGIAALVLRLVGGRKKVENA